MRTARTLTVSRTMVCGGGGVLSPSQGMVVLSPGVSAQGGVPGPGGKGGVPRGDVPGQVLPPPTTWSWGGVCVYLVPGGYLVRYSPSF